MSARTLGQDRTEVVLLAPDQLAPLAASWDALAARALEPNVFLSRWMAEARLRHLPDRTGARILVAFRGEGDARRLVGLMLLVRPSRRHFNIASVLRAAELYAPLSTPLMDPERPAETWAAMLAALAKAGIAALALPEAAADGPVQAALREAAEAWHHPISVLASHRRAILRSPLSGNDYLQVTLGKRRRKEFDRQRRRLAELSGLELLVATGGEDDAVGQPPRNADYPESSSKIDDCLPPCGEGGPSEAEGRMGGVSLTSTVSPVACPPSPTLPHEGEGRRNDEVLPSSEAAHRALDAATALERFIALESAGWKGAAGTDLAKAPGAAAYFKASASAAPPGAFRVVSLLLDGKAVAAGLVAVAGRRAFYVKTAYDEALARYSPGLLLTLDLTKHLLDDPEIDDADSVADADHPMIDRIWTERLTVESLLVGTRAGGSFAFNCALAVETGRERAIRAVKAVLVRLRPPQRPEAPRRSPPH